MRARCLILWLCALAAFAAPTFAQTYSVHGTVTDEIGEPIEGAAVFVSKAKIDTIAASVSIVSEGSSNYDLTNDRGRFRVSGLGPGRYSITAYYTGKRLASHRETIKNQDVRVDFKLSIIQRQLEEITVKGTSNAAFGVTHLPPVDVEGVAIYDAKKSEVVMVDDLTANLATNNSRQIYGKIPGLNIWESDGAGVQLGLGGRGLNPNRNTNFNTRQNGYDIAADALGYPESYYTPPVRALKRIEIVRGAASLQYGTQFGGLLNFVFKDGPESRPFEVSSSQSVGSFGLFNSFNSVGGSTDAVRYYGFYQYKRSDGWRPNSEIDHHSAYASITYRPAPGLSIRPEFTYMHYLAHQPGGLTDAQFERDPQQSTRERNWFRVDWNLLALRGDYRFSSATSLNTRFFALLAGRDAVGNLGRVDRIDFGGNRDLLKDDFSNWGNETRLIHRYPLRGNLSVFLVGTRYYQGLTHRRQGDGSANSDPDFDYLQPTNLEGSDFDLPSRNVSVFAENVFNVTPRLSITPGIRFEHIRTGADGYYRNIITDLAGNTLVDERIDEERARRRSFVFFGLGASYTANRSVEVYTNFSQNYRAINFNDIRVNIGSLEVDPNLDDERGFNVDLGARGALNRFVAYDVSLFHLSYRDRIGTILRTEPNPQFNNLVDRTFRYRTNIADARIYGMEAFVELDVWKLLVDPSSPVRLSVFTNLALISAEYANSGESGVEGNEVEMVPRVNLKSGIKLQSNQLEVSAQLTHVSEHFSDASNAVRTPTAIEGIIPSYRVMDVSAEYQLGRVRLEAGVNNLTDQYYFTRRATGYPGPGIIPSEGRSIYTSVGITL